MFFQNSEALGPYGKIGSEDGGCLDEAVASTEYPRVAIREVVRRRD